MSSSHATIESVEASKDSSQPGLQVACLAVILILLLGVYWRILLNLVTQWWDDPNYSHGFLVPLFSLYIVWQQRRTLRALPRSGSLLGIPLMLTGIATLILGDLGAENFLMRSSLLVIIAGLILFHFGSQILRAVAFPLVFLVFMIPLPGVVFYAVTFPLQRLAAEQAAWILETIGIPVLLDGNIIHLTQMSLGVTEACSGIRSLISLFAGAAAWAYLLIPGGWSTIIFIAATVPITILANAVRVVLTGLIGQQFGVEYASGFFHEFAGWVIYIFAFLCLLAVYSLIRALSSRQWSRTP